MTPLLDIDTLLREDAPTGDLTSEALGLAGRRGRISFTARGAGVVAGVEIAAAMFARVGVAVEHVVSSGDAVAPGAKLLKGEGDAAALHLAWKSAQTLVEALSGIATAARAIVEAARAVNPDIQVACTRKTFPGGRILSQFAVRAGGAILHRAGLSETILVFPEHLAFAPGASLEAVVSRLRRTAPEKKLAVEVGSVAEAAQALAAGFDVIQLEKFTPHQTAEVAALARGTRALVAAAGGINAANAADYVRAGAGLLVSSAPYSAPPCDVKVTIEALGSGGGL